VWLLLPLLMLPAAAHSQGEAQAVADPAGLGYESATDSFRGLDSEPLAADTETAIERDARSTVPATAAALPDSETASIPAGDMPAPVDPVAEPVATDQDPANVTNPSPDQRAAFGYDSVFDDYEPYEQADGPGWVESNDTVGKIGGWRTYAREIYESNQEEENAE